MVSLISQSTGAFAVYISFPLTGPCLCHQSYWSIYTTSRVNNLYKPPRDYLDIQATHRATIEREHADVLAGDSNIFWMYR